MSTAPPPPGVARAVDDEVRAFLRGHAVRLRALIRASHSAAWDAAAGGGDEAQERSARARAEVRRLYADAGDAHLVRAWLHGGEVTDPLLRRQLVVLDHEYTGNQLPDDVIDDLVQRAAELEGVFHTFRASLNGRRVTNNEILDVLEESRCGAERRAAWEASKQVGREVAEPLRELARRRNAAARSLGFADHWVMELALQEMTEAQLFGILDEFERESEAPFRAFRAEVDETLAARHGVSPSELRPWHWEDPFAQEAPGLGHVDLDAYFAGLDPVEVCGAFFRGIGLPVEDVLARSDLYEREGKDQHAFCLDVDREGDVRILCNLRPNEKWTSTLLHELGHAAYDAYLPRSLPYVLRFPAHIFATEAVAMYAGRLTRDPRWLRDVLGVELDAETAAAVHRELRATMLVSTRWTLVMVHFERALYADPDRADLNALWWELVERFQRIRRPEGRDEPDWAAKVHLSASPVYYHNYLLGQLMASQISAASRRGIPECRSIAGQPSAGAFLRDEIFAHGASLRWDELLLRATGETLTPRHFIAEFVNA